MAANKPKSKKIDTSQLRLQAAPYKEEIVKIWQDCKSGIYSTNTKNLFRCINFFAQHAKHLPECSNDILNMCRACLIQMEINSSEWDSKALNKIVILCTTLLICRKEENIIRSSCNILTEILSLLPANLLNPIVQKHSKTLAFILTRLATVQTNYTQVKILHVFFLFTKGLPGLRNDIFAKHRFITRARKEIAYASLQSLSQINLDNYYTTSRVFLKLFNTYLVKKIFVLSTEGFITQINQKPIDATEMMAIDFNGRNLTLSFFAPKKLFFNLDTKLMTEYGAQDMDGNQMIFVEIQCDNIEAKMKKPNSGKALLQIDISVAKIIHIKSNNNIEQRIFGLQNICFVMVDTEPKVRCFLEVFYNRYKSYERMSNDDNNSLLDQESLMSYKTNASMLSNDEAKGEKKETIIEQVPYETVQIVEEKNNTQVSEKIDTQASEKIDTQAPEKIDTQAPEKIDTQAPEKINTQVSEKINTQFSEKIDKQVSEKIVDENLDKTQVIDSQNLNLVEIEKPKASHKIKKEGDNKKQVIVKKKQKTETPQKVPKKRGRKPGSKKTPIVTELSTTSKRPKRQSIKKINYKDEFDIPLLEEMPSYRDFMNRKRDERSTYKSYEEEDEEYAFQLPNTKLTKKKENDKKAADTKLKKTQKRSQQDAFENESDVHETFKEVKKNKTCKPQKVPLQLNKPQKVPLQLNKPQKVSLQFNKPQKAPLHENKPSKVHLRFNKHLHEPSFEKPSEIKSITANRSHSTVLDVENNTTTFELTSEIKSISAKHPLRNVQDVENELSIFVSPSEIKPISAKRRQPTVPDVENEMSIWRKRRRIYLTDDEDENPPFEDSIENQNNPKKQRSNAEEVENHTTFVSPSQIKPNSTKYRRLTVENVETDTSSCSKNIRIAEWIESSSQLNTSVENAGGAVSDFLQDNEDCDEDIDVVNESESGTSHKLNNSPSYNDESASNQILQENQSIRFDNDFDPCDIFQERSKALVSKFRSRYETLAEQENYLDAECEPIVQKLVDGHLQHVREAKSQLNIVMQLNKRLMTAKSELVDILKKKSKTSKQLKNCLGKCRHLYDSTKHSQLKELDDLNMEVDEANENLKQEIWREYVENLHKKMVNSFKKALEL